MGAAVAARPGVLFIDMDAIVALVTCQPGVR